MKEDNFTSAGRIRCRPIEFSDIANVASVFALGFGASQPLPFWQRVFETLHRRAMPVGDLPRYGYLLEAGDRVVGAILLIYSTRPDDHSCPILCNVSSWYVEPAFRAFASLLVSQALRRKNVTYFNTSAAPHTRRIVEAQGYTCYARGVFIAVPWLGFASAGDSVRVSRADVIPDANWEPHARKVLLDHADYGCISLWCVASGIAYPFIFRSRPVKRLFNVLQLIYCPSVDCFTRSDARASIWGWLLLQAEHEDG